ncbi:MAG: type II toxin-antitoxin system RelE/ParE family toxin [Alphaproteobacteria bacterium]|jgi:proteic killer suppression protein|nr:type II toxin-antitoxin system RelE/ParE family toxin [Alphaproteobacteria bacterium]MDP6567159.1 type II toxin-antitoxin system RelE/ParE family toxin [Alphaproteobacteria bacterium]MDP6815252.1 type II toxin-antitoxin system RelE/ParE family toxin [Alphaproteobacteria bacterium]|tara:strand:- start:310 stop:600 length:291 start_codon:yes stop_codon:yes gene_type:complete
MEIRNIRHKGLRNYVEKNNARGLQQDYVSKIADIMAFLIDMESIDEVFDLRKYKPHLLTGDRAGTYSFHVTANWRITFRHDVDINELYDVDYEDYH